VETPTQPCRQETIEPPSAGQPT